MAPPKRDIDECPPSHPPSPPVVSHLRIPLRDIVLATNNFAQQNLINQDRFEDFYKAQLFRSGQLVNVVVQRLRYGHPHMFFPKPRDYVWWKIYKLSVLKHKIMVSIVGFCDENDEIIIINEHVVNGSLDKHLPYPTLTWIQRLHICVGVAHAISSYAFKDDNIKSSKVLLDKDWEPMFFAISYSHSELDLIQTFGVLMCEVLCDRKKMIGATLSDYVRGIRDEIIDPNLRKQMDPYSLGIFSGIAINCMKERKEERHKIDDILKQLKVLERDENTTY